jgi:nucleoside-diphosphate-sugar epimerase
MYMLPDYITTENQLTEVMTRPDGALVEFVSTLSSPLLILGAGGKMGPTLAVLAHRAVRAAGQGPDIIAVSRYSDQKVRKWLERQGVKTMAADLMERSAMENLPESDNVIYMIGWKFGTTGNPAWTWAVNTLIPSFVGERYPHARIAALSSGNVYPLTSVTGGGSLETDPLTPLGEYANSCVARERILEFYSLRNHTPVALIRLSYALDLRYGVLVDIAQKVLTGEPIDIRMGYANGIWQGDANSMIIRSLGIADTPANAINLTAHRFSVREVAKTFGALMGRQVTFKGTEQDTAYLSDLTKMTKYLGHSAVPLEIVIQWTAHWITNRGRLLGKPTHFETRDGDY